MSAIGTGVITFVCTTKAEYDALVERLTAQAAERDPARTIVIGIKNPTKRTVSVTVTYQDVI